MSTVPSESTELMVWCGYIDSQGLFCEISQQKHLTEAKSLIYPSIGFCPCPFLFHSFCPSFLLLVNEMFKMILLPRNPRPEHLIPIKDTISSEKYSTKRIQDSDGFTYEFSQTFKEKIVSSKTDSSEK